MTTSYDDRLLDFSDNFVFSCGTVPIDITRGLVLLLYYRIKGEYILPKGRKDVGESFEIAAIRETLEETGYSCVLLQHDLPTKATTVSQGPHTEPIAVQQRFHRGTRKIILWYLAEVNAYSKRLPQCDEDQVNSEVRWLPYHNALSTISFKEDRRIIERALSAIPPEIPSQHLTDPRLFEGFLDPSVDLPAMGFLCISLGGSLPFMHLDAEDPESQLIDTDWDGIAILKSQSDIIRLLSEHRSRLCALLRIHIEECPNLRVCSQVLSRESTMTDCRLDA